MLACSDLDWLKLLVHFEFPKELKLAHTDHRWEESVIRPVWFTDQLKRQLEEAKPQRC